MIDFIIEIPPECCYGVIEDFTSNAIIKITNESWAPGIWAGAEKFYIEFRNEFGDITGVAQVLGVNLEKREISVDRFNLHISNGNKIYPCIGRA